MSAAMRENWHPSPPAATMSPPAISPLASVSLHSERVVIGPVLPEDTGVIFLWLNDLESTILDMTYRPVDWMSYNNWLGEFSRNPAQTLFVVRRTAHAAAVGFVLLTKINPIHRSADIGLRIGAPQDRGQGLGREALMLGLRYAWDHLNLHRVQLSVFESNQAARRAYRAAGFEEEGTLRQAAFINGRWENVVVMSALRP
jgi:RimJ/RimL family protein N-acetyltransferase